MAERRRKSKKRSVASNTDTLPESLTFFLDQSLGDKVVASALRREGLRVELLKDHFPTNSPDSEWLPEVGRRGWLILTKDDRIRRRPVERLALQRSRARAFILPSGNMSGDEMAYAVIEALSKIRRVVERRQPPLIARITRAGELRLFDLDRLS